MNEILKLFLFISLFFGSLYSQGKPTLLLTSPSESYALDSFHLEQIQSEEAFNTNAIKVIPNTTFQMSNPDTSKAYWYRVTLKNNTNENNDWLLISYFYTIDEIDVFLLNSKGKMSKQYFRETSSFYDRAIHHVQPTFQISIEPGETQTLFIKVKNESTYEYAFGIFSYTHFINSYLSEYQTIGLFYGFMLFILIYSIINYLFFRDKVLLLYILFISAQIVHMLFRDGKGLFLFPDFLTYADLVKNLSRASISIFIVLYTLLFLKISTKSLTFKLCMTFVLARFIFALYMMENTSAVTFHFELFAILISAALSINAFINKVEEAKFMVIGFSLMSISYFIFYLSVVWFSSLGTIGFFIIYFGIALESIFTTLALTDRYKRIQLGYLQKKTMADDLERSVQSRTEVISMQNKMLEDQSAELNSFLYSASHDLSGPLKSLKGLLNLAEIDPEANFKDLIKMMHEKIEDLESNVHDLNTVSLIKDKNKYLEVVNFNTIHNELLKSFEDQISTNAITITLNNTIKDGVTQDAFAIRTIYLNLVNNAIKFHDNNKNAVLNITIEAKKGNLVLSFEDNGIGIEAAHLEKIFSMFYRGSDMSNNDTGIGLYIVYLAVKKLNGNIKVESTLGKGSWFVVTVPILG